MRLLAFAALFASSNAFAAACPSYDTDLGSAVGAQLAMGNTCGTTNDVGLTCTTSTAEELTYLWTAPATDSYQFTTNGSTFDTALSIQDAGCAELACNDDGGAGLDSALTLSATSGTQYFVNVDGYGANCGDFYLSNGAGGCSDEDADGVCADLDICVGDDALGDSDFDYICGSTAFELVVTTVTAGQPFTATINNGPANGNVVLLASGNFGFTCHPSGAPCVDLATPRVIGRISTNANGTGSLVVNAPPRLPPTLLLQAATLNPADVTNLYVQ